MQGEVWQFSEEARLVHPEDTDIFAIYGQQSGVQYELNESAYKILERIASRPLSIEALREAIVGDYQIDAYTAEADIFELLRELEAERLLIRKEI